MRVLLMNQFFWPDSAATGQLLTDVAQDLVSRGHTVDVICGGSYAENATQIDLDDIPAIIVHRVSGMRFSRSTLGRMTSYATFYLGAFWRALRLQRPDVVMTLTTPPLLSVAGAALKILRGSRLCIWEMDIYPDVAVDLGYIRAGGMIDRAIGALADWSRRRADRIILLGECMRDRLAARGLMTSNMVVVDNWADSETIRVLPGAEKSIGSLHIVYSGNLGLAHDVSTVMVAIQQLDGDGRFQFTFVGGGARRKELSTFVETAGVKSVEFRPYAARADLSESLGMGDIGLVTQRDDCCGSVVPSKVYGLLAAGRPYVFIGPAAARPAQIIQQFGCGWHIPVGESIELVNLLRKLAEEPELIAAAGAKGRYALEQHFDRKIGTNRIVEELFAGTSADSAATITGADGGTARSATRPR